MKSEKDRPEYPDVAALARRIEAERAKAATLCDATLAGPAAWWPQRVRASREARTGSMVQELIDRTRSAITSSPEHAELLSGIALELVSAIDADSYPQPYLEIVQGQALRNHAYVLSYRGRRTEAWSFAEQAQTIFDAIPTASYELARLALVKASILQSSDRLDQALFLVRDAAETFLRFGDRARWRDARLWEGILLYNAGAVDRAYEVWKPLQEDPSLDHFSRTQVAHNIALCLADLGQHEAAIPYFYNCATQFDILGMPVEVTRSRAALGHSLVAAGRAHEAIPILESAAAQFSTHGMLMDAGLTRLELAEAHLSLSLPAPVAALCRSAIADFTRAGVAKYASAALAYLREATTLPPTARTLVRDAGAALRRAAAERGVG